MHVGLNEAVDFDEGKEGRHGDPTDVDQQNAILLANPDHLVEEANLVEALIGELIEILITCDVCSDLLNLYEYVKVDILQCNIQLLQFLNHQAVSVCLESSLLFLSLALGTGHAEQIDLIHKSFVSGS